MGLMILVALITGLLIILFYFLAVVVYVFKKDQRNELHQTVKLLKNNPVLMVGSFILALALTTVTTSIWLSPVGNFFFWIAIALIYPSYWAIHQLLMHIVGLVFNKFSVAKVVFE